MTGLMDGKKRVDMTSMYKSLKELGHRRIWLRVIRSGSLLFMVTFKNRRLARFDRNLGTWSFVKNADLVDDYPLGNEPDGEGLTELHERDERLFYLTMYGEDVDCLLSYMKMLDIVSYIPSITNGGMSQ
ncbi:hypothetical protein DTU70_15790 [Salmonella enterica subsp. enterica serovar Weltevreden]|nr:hypothetical protein [Salmonella enterica]EBX8804585.1 hypothetical protein [Salmonella enterica subsp. enterica serovar Weltevreden]EBX9287980.1 hypothetical protein [Salmonella enterica subsp. enterica serovar Brunei]ECK2164474.1 hypothetical protein [Salmonella enterica subsp. enterica]EAX1863989.1 hypothetical protein [Salmonella enterica]